MTPRSWLWILLPLALSAGVIWVSAQDAKPAEGLKLTELADKVQTKEKALVLKERQLLELEQRLATLQGTLDRDRSDLQTREQALQEAQARFEAERARPALDPQLVRTYEAMEPNAGSQALRELAKLNEQVAVSLLGAMQPKKAARIMDQVALQDARLAGRLSERVGLTKTPAASK